MLVGVAPLPPSLTPTLWNIGILHYKQAKLRKDMQQSVILVIMSGNSTTGYSYLFLAFLI